MVGPLRTVAGVIADRSVLPTSVRAATGYFADTGVFDIDSVRLKSTVDDRTEAMIDEVFRLVEDAIAEEFDAENVTFSYGTKLVLPAQLTLGHVYREARIRAAEGADPVELGPWASRDDVARGPDSVRDALAAVDWEADPGPQELVDRGELLTRLVVEALIDGDMRDAVNDDEYEDFEVSLSVTDTERARVAELAQETLQNHLETLFEEVPDAVRERYDWAVEISEAHQDRDDHFRELYERAREGDAGAREAITEEYRDAALDVETDVFEDTTLPYLKTQYARVGVIYDGMVEMYREAGLPVETAFKRSIVLAIVGAQIWLDDVDDYAADLEDGQLTPVTAEYVLAESDAGAYANVLDITDEYLDRAKRDAVESDAPLAGIATEYIYRSGDPSVLPR